MVNNVSELLRTLAIKGCIVTVDAIGCQKSIAEQVIEQQADYVRAAKENQPQLWVHICGLFDRAVPSVAFLFT